MASLLTATFGCPGDDSTGDDANTTVNTSEPGTNGDTSEPPATSTGEPPATSTGEPPATSTGEPPAESSSSGADEGSSSSSSGGMINPACEMFCNDYFAMCGSSDANDYGDPPTCVDACNGYDPMTFDCKEYHVSMADGPDSVHCSHANLDGGGVC